MASTEDLLVRIDATTEQLRRELKRADTQVARSTSRMDRSLKKVDRAFAGINAAAKKAATGLGAIGLALSGGAIANGIDRSLRALQEVQRTALALGESTDTIQELNYTFEQFGLQSDDVSDALNTLSDRAQDAIDGTKSMQDDFALLGLSVDDLKGKKPGELFDTVAGAVASVEDPTARAAAVVRTFGDDLGRRLLPLLIQGRDGMRDFRQEAHDLNAVLGYDAVKAGADAARELNKVKSIFSAQFNRAVADNADQFAELGDVFASSEFQSGMDFVIGAFNRLASAIGEAGKELGGLQDAFGGDLSALLNNSGPGLAYRLLTGDELAGQEQSASDKVKQINNALERQKTTLKRLGSDLTGLTGAGYRPGDASYDNVLEQFRQIQIAREKLLRQREALQSSANAPSMPQPSTGGGGGGAGAAGTGFQSVVYQDNAQPGKYYQFGDLAKQEANLRYDSVRKERAKVEMQWLDDVVKAGHEVNNVMTMADGTVVDLGGHMEDLGQESKDTAKTFSDDLNNAVSGWASNFSSALADAAVGADASFSRILESFTHMLAQMAIQQAVVNPMLSGMGFKVDGGRASGGPVSAGGLYQVNERGSPELLTMGSRQYLMMPNRDGHVTPAAGGGAGAAMPNINVIIERTNDGKGDRVEQKRGNGRLDMRVILDQADQYVADGIARGTGATGKQIQRSFGATRSTTPR